MRIGVVGDTHNMMTNVDQIVELFREARVERIVHTGDITQAKVLDRFAALEIPLLGVFGNNDAGTRESLTARAELAGMDFIDPPRTIEWADRRILVAHDPEEIPPTVPADIDLILHGHTHRHRLEDHDGALIFNPGECAGMLAGRNAVGVVDLLSLRAELLRF